MIVSLGRGQAVLDLGCGVGDLDWRYVDFVREVGLLCGSYTGTSGYC
jgi:cyclopropane fatty-acyl-phospholipid synthase-like methyltransferase